jgi:hypothetical protein
MVEMGKILELFKLKLPVLAGIALALALFLFLPEKAANAMGIQKLRTEYKSYAGCAFLLASSLVVVRMSVAAFKLISTKCLARVWKKAAIERLKTLSPAEKQILCGYILPREKTQYLSIEDGVVNGLCQAHIIYRSANLRNLIGRGFAHNIQPWAWEYLLEHTELITEGVPKDAQGRIILYGNPFDVLGF